MSALDNAPTEGLTAMPAAALHELNAALYFARLKVSEARECEAALQLARQSAAAAAQAFIGVRNRINADLQLSLGALHDWNTATGDIVPVAGAAPC